MINGVRDKRQNMIGLMFWLCMCILVLAGTLKSACNLARIYDQGSLGHGKKRDCTEYPKMLTIWPIRRHGPS
jgi:hypothetical protein